jgi:hypothetical protein
MALIVGSTSTKDSSTTSHRVSAAATSSAPGIVAPSGLFGLTRTSASTGCRNSADRSTSAVSTRACRQASAWLP